MSIILNSCPMCWDSYDVCKCTENNKIKFEKRIKETIEKRINENRKYYHQLIDHAFSFKLSNDFPAMCVSKIILKELNRGEWEEIKKLFDKWFLIKGG